MDNYDERNRNGEELYKTPGEQNSAGAYTTGEGSAQERSSYTAAENYSGQHQVPPVESRQGGEQNRYAGYQARPQYDDSYNYDTQKHSGQNGSKKEKRMRGMAGILVAVCLASVIGGSLLTGFVIMPLISGSTATQQVETPVSDTAQGTDVLQEESADVQPELGGDAATISSDNPVEDVAAYAVPGVVSINTYNQSFVPGKESSETAVGYGSGFIISADGYILTNSHVVENADKVVVTLSDGTQYDAVVHGRDYDSDIAVLKIEATGLTALAIGNSDNTVVGEMVIAIGNPVNERLAGTVTVGYVSALNRELKSSNRTYHVLQTDAAINPGNSGGPLLNTDGEVIGMNTLKSFYAGYSSSGTLVSSEGIGFALPINYVMEIAEELIANGSIEKAGVGINYYLMSEEDAASWGVPQGALVGSVVSGGPADKAGIQENDIITQIDGQAITADTNLGEIIKEKGIGGTVTLTIWRNNKTADVTLEIVNINAVNDVSSLTSQQ